MKYNNPESRKSSKQKITTFAVNPPRDYMWKVLDCILDDVSFCLPETDTLLIKKLIRGRDFLKIMEQFEAWSLQSMDTIDMPLCEIRAKYQLASLLKKFPVKSVIDTKSAAVDKFLAAENQCRSFNLEGYRHLINGEDYDLTCILTYARSFIQGVIGDEPPDVRELMSVRHGPGSNIDTHEGLCSQFHKFVNWPYSVSTRNFGNAVSIISSDERWLGALEDSYRRMFSIPMTLILNPRHFWHAVLRICDEDRITTVPKTYLTDRSIAIPACMDLFIQLGIDEFIKRRLLRWDIDLKYGQAKNQEKARVGSITGEFATVDLKAASDTISLKSCELLLPPLWFTLLNDVRSPYGKITRDKDIPLIIKYEKLSSMGNGYTFAIETLIFSSLIYSTLRHCGSTVSLRDCAVYGDDLIVPVDIIPMLYKVINAFGFTVNEEKSFINGSIRESCGADWFNGKLIRPVFLTTMPKHVSDIFCDLNRLQRVLSLYFGIKRDESKTFKFLMSLIPDAFKGFLGPRSDEIFDSYIHSEQPANAVYSSGMWKFKAIISRSVKLRTKEFLLGKLMARLKKTSSISSAGNVFEIPKRNAKEYAIIYSSASHWQSEYTMRPLLRDGIYSDQSVS